MDGGEQLGRILSLLGSGAIEAVEDDSTHTYEFMTGISATLFLSLHKLKGKIRPRTVHEGLERE